MCTNVVKVNKSTSVIAQPDWPAHGHDELHGLASDGVSLGGPVEGGHGPCDANTQEHVDSVGAGDVSDGVVGAVVLNGGGLGGEGVCGRKGELVVEACRREISWHQSHSPYWLWVNKDMKLVALELRISVDKITNCWFLCRDSYLRRIGGGLSWWERYCS